MIKLKNIIKNIINKVSGQFVKRRAKFDHPLNETFGLPDEGIIKELEEFREDQQCYKEGIVIIQEFKSKVKEFEKKYPKTTIMVKVPTKTTCSQSYIPFIDYDTKKEVYQHYFKDVLFDIMKSYIPD